MSFDIYAYLKLDLILFLSIIGLIFIFNKKFMVFLDKLSLNFRTFIKRQEGFFSLAFIILFALEQISLILLIYYFREDPIILRLIVSFFALIVLTTASLQKFILDTKRRYELDAVHKVKIALSKFILREKKIKAGKHHPNP